MNKFKRVKPSVKRVKVPPKWPEWVCKCMWDATAVRIIVEAKDETDAWDRAWRKVSKMEGGDSCLRVTVKPK